MAGDPSGMATSLPFIGDVTELQHEACGTGIHQKDNIPILLVLFGRSNGLCKKCTGCDNVFNLFYDWLHV